MFFYGITFNVREGNMKVKVNDVVLNYDVSGTGYPIILLHGNGENYTIFNKLIEKLQ